MECTSRKSCALEQAVGKAHEVYVLSAENCYK